MQPRFSLRQMLELLTVGAVVLAVGKFAEVYGSKAGMNAWTVIVFGGAVSGACLGLRWFAHREVADCGLYSLAIGTVTTGIALLPFFLNALIFAIRPTWLLQWDPLGELKVGVVVVAVGGILASLLALPPAAFLKLSKR